MWNKVRRFFVSLNTASFLLIFLAFLSLLAGFFPQFPTDIKSPEEAQQLWNALRERYGPFFPLLKVTGLFSLARSPFFWGIFFLLLVSAIVCSWARVPKKFRLPRWGSILAHLGLILLAIGLASSVFFRQVMDSPPLVWKEGFDLGGIPITVEKVWVERSPEGVVLAFGCEVKSSGKVLKLSPGWPGLASNTWIIPLYYGPAWRIKATSPSGEDLPLVWKGRTKEGEIIVPFPALGEAQEIAVPKANTRLEISVQTQGTFVEFYEGEKLVQRVIVQEETEIEGEKVHLRLSPEHYIVLRWVKDPGFWPAIAGAIVMALGFGVALFAPKKAGA